MNIDRAEVDRIATLAHLDLEADERARMASELTRILDYVEKIVSAELTGEGLDPTETAAPLRDDHVDPSMDREAVEANAPRFLRGFFVVPKVIGGDS